jgi:hypothetical protein
MDSNGLVGAVLNVPVVSVALGLMFTYLIASLVASAVKEMAAGVFQWRGTYLQRGIGVLLSNTPGTAFGWGWKWLAAHVTWMDLTRETGTVMALAAQATHAARKAIGAAKAALAPVAAPPAAAAALPPAPAPAAAAPPAAAVAAPPADVVAAADAATIAADAAATALNALRSGAIPNDVAEIVRRAVAATRQAAASVEGMAAGPIAIAERDLAAAAAAVHVQQVQTHPLIKGTPSKLPSYVPARDFATAMLDLLRDGSASPAFSQVERTIAALPDGDVKRILTAFVRDAAGDLDKLRARIETWFDDAMDRLSGIYKRFAQYFLLALGILIAVVLNIDSVHLAVALYQQPTLRAQIVAEIPSVVSRDQGTSGQGSSATTPAPGATGDPAADLQQAVQQMQSLALPIGRPPCASFFGEPDTAAPAQPAVPTTLKTTGKPVVCASKAKYHDYAQWAYWTVLGWLITGVAISLGAPFWFGLLQNIMNLRAAGAPPPRADAASAAPAQ